MPLSLSSKTLHVVSLTSRRRQMPSDNPSSKHHQIAQSMALSATKNSGFLVLLLVHHQSMPGLPYSPVDRRLSLAVWESLANQFIRCEPIYGENPCCFLSINNRCKGLHGPHVTVIFNDALPSMTLSAMDGLRISSS